MTEDPVCTVVTAAYNAAATIGQSIASVLTQTRRDWELIVVDDGSTDDTAELVLAYAADRRVRLHRQENAGQANARNAALRLARGRYVAILDSDDFFLPRYLELMVGALERVPQAGFAYTRAWVLEPASNTIRRTPWHPSPPTFPPDDSEALLRSLIASNFVCSSVTVRKDVLAEVGGYDPYTQGAEDYALSLAIAAAGHCAVAAEGPLLVRSDTPGSFSKDDLVVSAAKIRAYERLLERTSLPADVRTLAGRQMAETARYCALVAGERRPTPVERLRKVGGHVTRPVRERLNQRRIPPPEVAARFPRLGTGRHSIREASGAPSSLTTTVVRGAGIAGVGYAFAQLISFASYLALARLLTPSQFGVFAAAIVVVGLGQVVGESGMLAAVIQRRDRLEEALESAFVATLGGGLLLSLLGLAAAPFVGFFFHHGAVELVAAVMSATMLFRLSVIVPNALLQRRFSFLRRVAIDPLGMLAFAAGSVASAAAGLGVWSLVIGTYAQLAVDFVASWCFAGWRPHPSRASVAMWRELARFGRPVVIAEAIRQGIDQLPVIALGRFAGAGPLGQFSYAMRVASQPFGAILGVGAYVLLPALSRVAHDERRFRRALTRALRWMCATSFPLGMLLVALGAPAIVLIFGPRWHGASQAVVPLGVYAAVLALDSIASEVWKAAGRPEMLPRMHGLSFVLMAALIAALVIPFGLIGVSVAIALSGFGVGAFAVNGIHRVASVPRSVLFTEIWPPAVAAVAMAGGLFCLEHLLVHSAARGTVVGLTLLVTETVLGLVAYLACLAALSPGVRADLVAALGGLRRRRHSGDTTARRITLVSGPQPEV